MATGPVDLSEGILHVGLHLLVEQLHPVFQCVRSATIQRKIRMFSILLRKIRMFSILLYRMLSYPQALHTAELLPGPRAAFCPCSPSVDEAAAPTKLMKLLYLTSVIFPTYISSLLPSCKSNQSISPSTLSTVNQAPQINAA